MVILKKFWSSDPNQFPRLDLKELLQNFCVLMHLPRISPVFVFSVNPPGAVLAPGIGIAIFGLLRRFPIE